MATSFDCHLPIFSCAILCALAKLMPSRIFRTI
jgi:hypothetical protein